MNKIWFFKSREIKQKKKKQRLNGLIKNMSKQLLWGWNK